MPGKAAKAGTKHKVGSMNDLMRAFAHQYVIDFNGKNAAIRAGYKESSAAVQASKLLAREDIQAIIEQKMARIEANTGIRAETVIEQTWGIATADVNDLVEFRRRCCRHCWGIDYGYQRTTSEMSRDLREYNNAKTKALAKDPNAAAGYDDFDERGGPGFDARLAPNPDCENCWGDGVGDAFFKPTASLTPAARALYAGVKQTKDGYQMLTIDKLGALEKLFKHLNLYKEENKAKVDGLAALMADIQARNSRLPIKPQE
jgi:phage terminase small subunit